MSDSAPDFFLKMDAPPEGAICDFCSSPNVRWTFPCREHTTAEHVDTVLQRRDGSLDVERMDIERVVAGGWAACPACHALVIRGEREKLARRSAKRMIRKHPDVPMLLGNVTVHCRRLQDAFWANRTGPPIPHNHRPTEDPTA